MRKTEKPRRPPSPVMSGLQRVDRPASYEDTDWDQDADSPVQPLTRQEVQALVARRPSLSVWQIIAAQALCGVLVALVWGALARSSTSAISALYGGAVVVVPNTLMALGVFGRGAGRSMGGLLLWEFLKMGLAGAMLALAPTWVKPLDWAAMLVTLVLCMKVIGVALLIRQGR